MHSLFGESSPSLRFSDNHTRIWYRTFLIWPRQFIWSGKFPDLSEHPRGTLLETHSMDALVIIDGVFSGHCLVDGRMTLLATLLCRSHSADPQCKVHITPNFSLNPNPHLYTMAFIFYGGKKQARCQSSAVETWFLTFLTHSKRQDYFLEHFTSSHLWVL